LLLYGLAFATGISAGAAFAALPPQSANRLMDAITEIDVDNSEQETIVSIQGNGRIPNYATRTIPSPPRIVVDLLTDASGFKSMRKPVNRGQLESIRVGHHPGAIRLVLDLSGPDIVAFSTTLQARRLVITLHKNTSAGYLPTPPAAVDTGDPSITTLPESQNQNSELAPQATVGADSSQTASNALVMPDSESPNPAHPELFDAMRELMHVDASDDAFDMPTYLSAVTAYRAQNWKGAIEHLNRLVQNSAPNTHVEKAYFLLAKSIHQLYAHDLDNHFNAIWDAYKDAIFRFPYSSYMPDAYLSIGNLFLKSEIYTEAWGYYNLVIEADHYAVATVRALIKKAQILTFKKKKIEALDVYNTVIYRYPPIQATIQAKVEMAGILFELNQFSKALSILEALDQHGEHAYAYPEMFRYLGNIYYQIGSYAQAREQLFRFYNCRPDTEESPLVLARIADAFREEGLLEEATKFYRLTLSRHAQTEGALISMYRLAAMQESGGIKADEGLEAELDILGGRMEFPRKIYEDVIQNAIANNRKTPLLQYALLKLSILDQREGQYAQSLNRLKELLQKYPQTTLKREIEETFGKALTILLQNSLAAKKYKHVLNMYQAEKENINALDSAEIYITIGRAAVELKLTDLGVELFEKAADQLPDEKKPADLLFHLGRAYYQRGSIKRAHRQFDLLLNDRPEDVFTAEAYMVKGQLFLAEGHYAKAAQVFAKALQHNDKSCEHVNILMHRTTALLQIKSKQDAVQSLNQAQNAAQRCLDSDAQMYAEIGNLYIELGQIEKALEVLGIAHDMESDARSRVRLKIQMARCYELTNQKDSYLAIYTEIANQGDPFWRNVAQEKMEAMNFKPVGGNKK